MTNPHSSERFLDPNVMYDKLKPVAEKLVFCPNFENKFFKRFHKNLHFFISRVLFGINSCCVSEARPYPVAGQWRACDLHIQN